MESERELQDASSPDNTDTSESSSDSEADESKNVEEIEQLQLTLSQNPNNYEAHIQLINALRKHAELEKLRAAREAMNALFPLSADMWRAWAQDEARLVSGPEGNAAVEELYERGVEDYLSVALWLEYLQFVEEHDTAVLQCTTEGLAKMRQLYERALSAAGLHMAEGWKIWKAYREFEKAVVLVMKDTNEEAASKGNERIRNLFHRQLVIPLIKQAETLTEYKEWEEEQGNHVGDESTELAGLPLNLISAYKKAIKLCNEYRSFEEKIAVENPIDADLLQNYLLYINREVDTGEPTRAQVLYERAIAVFPITHDLWIKYTSYLDTNLKIPSISVNAYKRAVGNCPWMGELWTKYLLALERADASEDKISKVCKQALQGGFQTSNEYLDLFLTRVDGLRRRISSLSEADIGRQTNLEHLRRTFNHATEFFAEHYPSSVDSLLQLHSYWADLGARLAKDIVAARGVWENMVKERGWMTEVWQGYISTELSLGNMKEVRSLYKRCFSRRLEGAGTELMCGLWIQFERHYGLLEDYDRALIKVAPRLAEVRSMQCSQEMSVTTDRAVVDKLASADKDRSPAKRKRIPGSRNVKDVRKRAKVRDDNAQLSLGVGVTEQKQVNERKEVTEEKVIKREEAQRPVYTDQCTAYVSNLLLEVTEEQLHEFLNPCGGVKEIRMPRDRASGRSRGFAYVDFEIESHLSAAIAKNKEKLCGRPVSIAKSNPEAKHGVKYTAAIRGRGGLTHGRQIAKPNVGHRRGGHLKLTGSSTFAVPQALAKPLGQETQDDVPKSNVEFRKLFLNPQDAE